MKELGSEVRSEAEAYLFYIVPHNKYELHKTVAQLYLFWVGAYLMRLAELMKGWALF